ncbi:MAG TPA: heme exporter protein CcmB [Thermoanaerobaculia bacterium]|nr:heme exporter protein CcmB [Thermoanaerobaculia bacterium]
MSALRQLRVLLGKDLRLEWRRRARLLVVLLFGVMTLLLFSFALGPDTHALGRASGGLLVLALLLSSTLGLAESFRVEHDDRALEGLLLLPVEPVAVFYAKALSNTLFLLVLGPVLAPVALILYAVQIDPARLFDFALTWLLAVAGLAAPGTLYAGMTSRMRGQDVLLPLLLFPLVVPMLLAAVKSMTLVILGDPMDQLGSWRGLLISFNVIYWSIGGILYPYVCEEGT